MDHPNIVRVHRVIEAWGTAYMVAEYVEGRSLSEELKAAGRLPERRVRELLSALLSGLESVHAAGLVHRDIKPRNVMLRGATRIGCTGGVGRSQCRGSGTQGCGWTT